MKKEEYPIFFEYCVLYKNYYWFVAANHSVICRMLVGSAKIEVIAPILEKTWEMGRQYFIAAEHKGRLILAPEFADEILEYDIEKNCFYKYEIKTTRIDKETFNGTGKDVKFRSSIVIDRVLWIIPQSCHQIIAFNMETHEIQYYEEWYERFEQNNWKDCDFLFGISVKVENYIYIPCCQLNAVLEFDTITKDSKVYFIGKEENRFEALAYTTKGFWLLDNKKKMIYLWNKEKIIKEIMLSDKFVVEKGYENSGLVGLYVDEHRVLMIPCSANVFVNLNLLDEQIEFLLEREDRQGFIRYFIDKENNRVIIPSQLRNQIVIFDMETNEMQSFYTYNTMEQSKEEINYFTKSSWRSDLYIGEKDETCSFFIQSQIRTPRISEGNECPILRNNIGQNIWKQVIEE